MQEVTLEYLESLDEEDLDELVAEIKSEEAAEINNGGKDAQVRFIASAYGLIATAD
jgi:hypothetical protein